MSCNHEGIGEPGCYVCDPDKGRVISALRAEVERLRTYIAKLESEPGPTEALAEVERLRAERDTARAIANANGHADLVVQRDRACAEVERLGSAAEALEAEMKRITVYLKEPCMFSEPCDLCRTKAKVLAVVNARGEVRR